MASDDKLSDYERIRFENIERNQAFLASLGLDDIKPMQKKAEVNPYKVRLKSEEKLKARRKRDAERSIVDMPTRSSKRIRTAEAVKEQKQEEDSAEDQEEEENDDTIYYDRMPSEANELDDNEFLLFIKLRKWRLLKARKLDIETYKIFPNRVLAEAIRRRRNDAEWACPSQREELVECWGIAKGKMESGVAVQLARQLEKKGAKRLLAKSRRAAPSALEGQVVVEAEGEDDDEDDDDEDVDDDA